VTPTTIGISSRNDCKGRRETDYPKGVLKASAVTLLRPCPPAQRRLVWRRSVEREAAKASKRNAVKQRLLHARREPISPQERRLEHRQGIVGRAAGVAHLNLSRQLRQRLPVNQIRYPLQLRGAGSLNAWPEA
jgi:hypothetical protein